MSDREAALLARWHREEQAYAAWGAFVVKRLSEILANRLAPRNLDLFLRVPMKFRVKEKDSLIQKAFHRKKPYADPYSEIEDKVGLRLVVLLSDDIRFVEEAIVGEVVCWSAEKARDFAEERDARPYEFDYQSLHYVVRSRGERDFDGTKIPAALPCEIQVRTLLQHAYSELTHDTIYKPSVTATPALKRAAAKSMALIEATDDYFSHVSRTIKQAVAADAELSVFLNQRYATLIGSPAQDSPLNSLIIDHYKAIAPDFLKAFDPWITLRLYVADRIRERAPDQTAFRAPAILLLYYAVAAAPRMSRLNSPVDDTVLEFIYSDLGQSLYG